jgi:hypothetical protein
MARIVSTRARGSRQRKRSAQEYERKEDGDVFLMRGTIGVKERKGKRRYTGFMM